MRMETGTVSHPALSPKNGGEGKAHQTQDFLSPPAEGADVERWWRWSREISFYDTLLVARGESENDGLFPCLSTGAERWGAAGDVVLERGGSLSTAWLNR